MSKPRQCTVGFKGLKVKVSDNRGKSLVFSVFQKNLNTPFVRFELSKTPIRKLRDWLNHWISENP